MQRQYIKPSGQVTHFPAIDLARLAAAHRARQQRGPRTPRQNLPAATSPEACHKCGIPGRKGCKHQAPYEPAPAELAGHRARVGLPAGHRFG